MGDVVADVVADDDAPPPPTTAAATASARALRRHTLVATAAAVSLFAMLGQLVRVLLEIAYTRSLPVDEDGDTTTSALAAFHPNVFANALGCALLGFVSSSARLRRVHRGVWHAALGTGLCGATTTFSGWASWSSRLFVSNRATEAVINLLCAPCLSLCCFSLGRHAYVAFAVVSGDAERERERQRRLLRQRNDDDSEQQPSSSSSSSTTVDTHAATADASSSSSSSSVASHVPPPAPTTSSPPTSGDATCGLSMRTVAAASTVLVVVVLGAFVALLFGVPSLRDLWASLLLTVPGALARWQLGVHLNLPPDRRRWLRTLPFGTLFANVVGVVVYAGATVLTVDRFGTGVVKWTLEEEAVDTSRWGLAMLVAVSSGFCGALTTMSTFVAEAVDKLPSLRAKYTYVVVSVASTQLLLLIVYGASHWAGDIDLAP